MIYSNHSPEVPLSELKCYCCSDRDGKLAISSKQKQYFSGWVRPEDYISEPQMIMAVSSFSVKQVLYYEITLYHVFFVINMMEI